MKTYGKLPTLAALWRDRCDIIAECRICRHKRKIPNQVFIKKLGLDCTILKARNNLKCSKCGSKDIWSWLSWPDLVSNNMAPGAEKIPK